MEKYDVIVAGGGTAGCAFAYTAGKLGKKVLLVEKNSYLGGSITSSLVIPAMKTSSNAINTSFFDKLYEELLKIEGAITYIDGNKGWFNPELTKIILDKLMKEANVKVMFESEISEIDKKLSVYSVTIRSNNIHTPNEDLLSHIETSYIVDGTGDAKICREKFGGKFGEKLGIKFLDDNKNQTQPINLRFIMSGVNTNEFSAWITELDTDRDVTTSCTIDGKTYVSTAYTWDSSRNWALAPIFKQAVDDGCLKESDTNYFQIFSVAGTSDSIAFNCPRLTENYSCPSDAYIAGRESILRISQFCKRYLKGFENAYISSIANSIGVRVSGRVKGKYVYTEDDLKTGKKFEHPVVISNYPIDIHSDKKDTSRLEKVYQEYQLPVESLIVDDGLFVIGRCLSAEFAAQAALRIIPSCFSMGEGLAKYLFSFE